MEQEAREIGSVTRSQNALYVMPHDWASMAQFLEPLIGKIDASSRDAQLLVIAPDAESAAAVGAAAVKIAGPSIQILAATSAARAGRLMKLRPAQIVTGSAPTIVELLRSASLKLDTVRAVCIAWADELITRGDGPALETVMTEVPKEASRTIVASDQTPDVDALVERYARRARKVVAAPNEADTPVAIDYVTVSPSARATALRRVLDAIDPLSALIFVREGESRTVVEDLLKSIGYAGSADVSVGLASAPGTALTVLYDLPASREELREAASGAARAIALAQPRQIASLRALAAGGALRPFTLPEAKHAAHTNEAHVRSELRAILDEGHFGRELLALEPLLESYDGIEIAAAALQLLERERRSREAAEAAVGAARREPAAMVRLFISVGARDGARASDLVGAIANQGGINSSELGKVDVRESHSIVEVSANTADAIIERVNGTTIKGRRAIVRRDEGIERPARPVRERGDRPERSDRGPRGDRGDRGDRAARGPRSDRGERGERSTRFERGDRPSRNDRAPRGDRPSRRNSREDRGA